MLTKAQKDRIREKLLADKAFRARFLGNPTREAAKLGIELTPAEHKRIKRDAATIKKNAAAYDVAKQYYKIGGPVRPNFLPIFPALV